MRERAGVWADAAFGGAPDPAGAGGAPPTKSRECRGVESDTVALGGRADAGEKGG